MRAKISQEERERLFSRVNGIEMTEPCEEHVIDPKYIKYDDNPDALDPYDTAMVIAQQMMGNIGYHE